MAHQHSRHYSIKDQAWTWTHAWTWRRAAFVTKKFTVRPLLRYLAIPQMNRGLEILRPLSEINEGLSWSAEPLSGWRGIQIGRLIIWLCPIRVQYLVDFYSTNDYE